MSKETEKENSQEESNIQDQNELISDLASFFDLLAKFDHDDKQKEMLVPNSGSLVSAPSELELSPNTRN